MISATKAQRLYDSLSVICRLLGFCVSLCLGVFVAFYLFSEFLDSPFIYLLSVYSRIISLKVSLTEIIFWAKYAFVPAKA